MSQEKVYDVEFELSENFLEKNPTIKSLYSEGKLSFPFLADMDKDFGDALMDVIPELRSSDIVTINPLLEAIQELLKADNTVGTTKPEKEDGEDEKVYDKRLKTWLKEQSEIYTQLNKTIGSFNSTSRTSKKIVKEPFTSVTKKIDVLYNALTSFSEQRREKLNENFIEYLVAKKQIEDEKQALKDKAANEKLEALQEENKVANEKLIKSQAKSSYADKMTEITQYYNSVTEEVEKRNEAGLQELVEMLIEKEWDFTSFGDMEQVTLGSLKKTLHEACLVKIKEAVDKPSETKTEDVPDIAPAPAIEEEVPAGNDNQSKIAMFNMVVIRLKNSVNELENIKPIQGEEFTELNEILKKQFSVLIENNNKLIAFVEKKKQLLM